MKWEIQYRKKGETTIKTEIVDIRFDKKADVKRWWRSCRGSIFINCIGSKTVGGYRNVKVWINCLPVIE
jgi:hypothetical protein